MKNKKITFTFHLCRESSVQFNLRNTRPSYLNVNIQIPTILNNDETNVIIFLWFQLSILCSFNFPMKFLRFSLILLEFPMNFDSILCSWFQFSYEMLKTFFGINWISNEFWFHFSINKYFYSINFWESLPDHLIFLVL